MSTVSVQPARWNWQQPLPMPFSFITLIPANVSYPSHSIVTCMFIHSNCYYLKEKQLLDTVAWNLVMELDKQSDHQFLIFIVFVFLTKSWSFTKTFSQLIWVLLFASQFDVANSVFTWCVTLMTLCQTARLVNNFDQQML